MGTNKITRFAVSKHRDSVVYWPAVVFVAVFEAISQEMKLALVIASLLVMAVRRKGNLDLRFPKFTVLLLAITLIGFFSGLANDQVSAYGTYRFLRDCAYYVAPFLLWILSCGMGRCLEEKNKLWTTLFLMSVASGFSMIVVGISSNGLSLSLESFKANEFTVYALVLMILPPKGWVWRVEHKKTALALFAVDALAVAISLSRTTLICLIVMLFVLAIRSFSHFFKVVTIGGVTFCAVVLLISFMPSDASGIFFEKIGNSLNEVSSSRFVWTDSDVVQNWRGFEKYQAINAFDGAETIDQVFGFGYGYQLNMAGYGYLVGADGQGIPFLHNGYYSVLLKCGIVGVGLLLLFYAASLVVAVNRMIKQGTYLSKMVVGLLACLIISSYVIEGLFIPSSLYYFVLPLGLFYGRALGLNQALKTEGRSGERGLIDKMTR